MKAVVEGGLAGFLATLPMTAVMELLHRQLPRYERSPLPPRKITMRLADRAGVKQELNEPAKKLLTLAAHFAYGSAVGAIYSAAARSFLPAGPAPGALYGLIVWAGSYLGILPAMRILKPATQHTPRRNLLMIFAHLVWGASLGAMVRVLDSAQRSNEREDESKPTRRAR